MPIWNYECQECRAIFELMFIVADKPKEECPSCKSINIVKVMSMPEIRIDSDSILKSLPDPTPPLEELRGTQKPGCEGGFSDKPETETNLGKYRREKDKRGNVIWTERKKTYFI